MAQNRYFIVHKFHSLILFGTIKQRLWLQAAYRDDVYAVLGTAIGVLAVGGQYHLESRRVHSSGIY